MERTLCVHNLSASGLRRDHIHATSYIYPYKLICSSGCLCTTTAWNWHRKTLLSQALRSMHASGVSLPRCIQATWASITTSVQRSNEAAFLFVCWTQVLDTCGAIAQQHIFSTSSQHFTPVPLQPLLTRLHESQDYLLAYSCLATGYLPLPQVSRTPHAAPLSLSTLYQGQGSS
jgi:hypothetical protein